jgi:HD-GYP domain-containing protein (c-di-GMP phosphodiesterase class II)
MSSVDLPTDVFSPLTLLLELGQAFHSTLELDPLLVNILRHMQNASQTADASLWLLDEERGTLRCTHAVGGAEPAIGESLAAAALREPELIAGGRVVKLDDAGSPAAARFLTPAMQARCRNALVAPLVARGVLLGMLIVANRVDGAAFGERQRILVAALAGHAALAIHNAQLYERQRRHAERQKLLEQISRHLQQTLDIDVLIPLILEEVNKAIAAEAQSVWLLNQESGCLECRFATGPGAAAIKQVSVPIGQGIVGRSVERLQAIVIPDAQVDDRVFHAADDVTGYTTRSLLCVPMVRQGKAIGAIEAVNKHGGLEFTADDLELLLSIADSAALALENARLYGDLSASYDSTLHALAAALDLRDRETEGHSRRVVEYTARLGRQIGLDEAVIAEICRGALLHDIGKIGVPDAILHKPGTLTDDERRIMEQHPQEGYEMLLGVPYLRDEIQIVLAHQEHWDGTGYPLGLKGEAIPLGARLFAVADTYDALTSDRPYRRSQPYADARVVIAAEAGRQFDPAAVAAFLAVPQADWDAIRRRVDLEVAARQARQRERVRAAQTGQLS